MDNIDNIEKMFYDEVREKKNIGRNIKYRKNRVYSNKILFPADYLSKKQKDRLNGGIFMSNLYDDITYQELLKLSNKDRVIAIEALIKKFSTRKSVAEHFQVKVQSIHDMYYRAKKLRDAEIKKTKENRNEEKLMEKEIKVKEKKVVPEIIDSKFMMRLVSEMSGEELQERIMSIGGIILKSKKYQVSFELREIDDKKFE